MGQIVSFQHYVPPARFDAIPWTDARIQEAPGPTGPWALIDTVALAVDADPSDPDSQSFTTDQGTAADLWYRVVFVDGALNVSEPTAAVQNLGSATADGIPCQEWITSDEVADCCSVDLDTTMTLSLFANEAVSLLYELSGRRFPGVCERVVRPCPTNCTSWTKPSAFAILESRRLGSGGCRPLSSVKLAGYPVREILEVTIDGDVVDPSGYRLDHHRDLVRLNDADGNRQVWPACQDLGLTDGDGTFFVTYRYGADPPIAGIEAAKQLACELARTCSASGDTGDCDLPEGTVRVTRQGVTIEAQTLGLFLTQGSTGLTHVDAFLAVYGGRARRPAVLMAPEIQPFAQEA